MATRDGEDKYIPANCRGNLVFLREKRELSGGGNGQVLVENLLPPLLTKESDGAR